jgi:NAD(P)-dependent dehydrogenase (short-subunit alcohol dehydrogenase family)
VPFNRQNAGQEMAHAVPFVISSESSYVSVHTLFLDGGHPGGIVRG